MEWLPIQKFDEARLAVNAIEMLQQSNYITTYFEGAPDLWNTKPPLLIWLQALSINCFGLNEFSTRLPSAIATLIICVILLLISLYILKNWHIGVCAIFVLITSEGFVNMHGSRSGDYDTLLTLFLFINGISFYLYTEAQNSKFAIVFFVSLILGVLTKGIAGCFLLPIYLLYLVFIRKLRIAFKWQIVLGLLISLSIVFIYYYIRECENPGYLAAVYKYELGGRYLKTLEGHNHHFLFYFSNMIRERFSFWFALMLLGIFVLNKDLRGRGFVSFCFFVGVCFLIIISFSQTKLYWYDMPIYPFFAIVAANGLFFIYKSIEKPLLANAFIICVLAIPYMNMFSKIYIPRLSPSEMYEYRLCEYIRENKNDLSRYDNLHINWIHYNAQNLFYTYSIKELNPNVRFKSDYKVGDKLDYNVGDKVLIYQDEVEMNIKQQFKVKLISYSEKYKTKIYELCK